MPHNKGTPRKWADDDAGAPKGGSCPSWRRLGHQRTKYSSSIKTFWGKGRRWWWMRRRRCRGKRHWRRWGGTAQSCCHHPGRDRCFIHFHNGGSGGRCEGLCRGPYHCNRLSKGALVRHESAHPPHLSHPDQRLSSTHMGQGGGLQDPRQSPCTP